MRLVSIQKILVVAVLMLSWHVIAQNDSLQLSPAIQNLALKNLPSSFVEEYTYDPTLNLYIYTVKVGEILGLVTEIEGEIKKSNEIKKIQPSNLQKNEELKEKDNVIKLDPIKEQAELGIFEEENNSYDLKEEPLVLTEEIKNSHIEENSTEESQTLSPAVRKMVDENNIDIKSVKGSGKDGHLSRILLLT